MGRVPKLMLVGVLVLQVLLVLLLLVAQAPGDQEASWGCGELEAAVSEVVAAWGALTELLTTDC
jgi:hypothetical protein